MLRVLQALALAFALIGASVGATASVGSASYSEDEVEAAFLYRFVGFVHWPPGALDPSVFTVDVLDDDAVAGDLERMASQKELPGRRMRVRSITSIDQLGTVQLLYIGASNEGILRQWLARIAGRPVLVVTNQPGGLDAGSTINFLLVDHRVRFEISLSDARRAGLEISADLLSVAMRVQGGPVGSRGRCELAPPHPQPRYCSPRLGSL